MDRLSPEAAATFLEEFAAGLSGHAATKWTGEWETHSGIERRLVALAEAIRKSRTAPGALTEADAGFVLEQAELLRSPNRLSMEGPASTAEWRLKAEAAMEDADVLEDIAELIRGEVAGS
ncbi:MAG TPA: hypothetical protein VFU23_04580 [Gemmatimonadales bacterium]|nr:hypothetical protein [Gemmatimonadales bacterium]